MTEQEIDELVILLIDNGLTQRQAEDISLLLRYKPSKVQRAFVLRIKGRTLSQIAGSVEAAIVTVNHYLKENCEDIQKYLSTDIEKTKEKST